METVLEQLVKFHKQQGDENFLDIREDHFKMTDAEAKIIMKETCRIENVAGFLEISITDRNVFIQKLREKDYQYGKYQG